jgi:DNA-binding transcriptional LysR family regulator
MESFFPEFLAAFRRTHPHVDVRLIQDVAPQLLARLERGELHVVVANWRTR